MEKSIDLQRVNNTYFKFFLQFLDLFLSVGALFFQVITLDLCILQFCNDCFMFISEKRKAKEFRGQQPVGPAGDSVTQVVSGRCLMSLSGHLLRPVGIGPPYFSFIRYILVLCL